MRTSSFEFIDLIIFVIAASAITAWSFYTLDRDLARAEKLTTRGQRLPWRYRHFSGKSRRDIQADILGKGISFFLMLTSFAYLKTLGLTLGYRLAASAAICIIIFTTIPRMFVVIDRKLRTRPERRNQ